MRSRSWIFVVVLAVVVTILRLPQKGAESPFSRAPNPRSVAETTSAATLGRVVAIERPTPAQEIPRRSDGPRAAQPPPPELAYAFVGRITEQGRTAVILRNGARVVTVRDTGRLDDQYEVVAILEDHLVLRHLQFAAPQVLAMSSRQLPPASGSPSDSEQD
jgi:hypothetical protein